jgi:hypothetical protein
VDSRNGQFPAGRHKFRRWPNTWEQMVAAPLLFQYPAIAGSTFAFVGDEVIPVEEHNSIVPEKYWPSPVGDTGHVIYQWASYNIHAIHVESGEPLWVESLNGDIYHGVAGWTSPSGSGGGIAAITSPGTLLAEGPWTGGKLDPPSGSYTVSGPVLSGDFGFVAQTADGRLVGVPVEPDE